MKSRRNRFSRRALLGSGAALAGTLLIPRIARAAAPKVVVVGGGFGGVSVARALMALEPGYEVTLIEPNSIYATGPGTNRAIAGLIDPSKLEHGYRAVAAHGIRVVKARAAGLAGKSLRLEDGSRVPFDRLIVAPGVDLRWDAIAGYGAAAAEIMPHAWMPGPQTSLLRRQLEAMEDGGVVAISVPVNPTRCPPAPYERASLITEYLKRTKPRSKVLILDAKESFPGQKLFEEAWARLYPGLIEWVPLSKGGQVTGVDPKAMTLSGDFDTFHAAVANVIPPQRAGVVADKLGVADYTGWCPIDPISFESALQPGVHVIGDAALSGALPKSAFAADICGKACAAAVISLLKGEPPAPEKLINVCYFLAGSGYGFSITGVFEPKAGEWSEIEGTAGGSEVNAPDRVRASEATFGAASLETMVTELFG